MFLGSDIRDILHDLPVILREDENGDTIWVHMYLVSEIPFSRSYNKL